MSRTSTPAPHLAIREDTVATYTTNVLGTWPSKREADDLKRYFDRANADEVALGTSAYAVVRANGQPGWTLIALYATR